MSVENFLGFLKLILPTQLVEFETVVLVDPKEIWLFFALYYNLVFPKSAPDRLVPKKLQVLCNPTVLSIRTRRKEQKVKTSKWTRSSRYKNKQFAKWGKEIRIQKINGKKYWYNGAANNFRI